MKILRNGLLAYLSLALITGYVFASDAEDAVAAGKEEFLYSCSLCHGEDAKGKGVFSTMLTVPVADLTVLQRNNDGVFPFYESYKKIDGRGEVRSHALMNMPVWGDRFSQTTQYSTEEKYNDTLVRGKIFELLVYLRSIQEE